MNKQELIKHIEDLPYKEGHIVDKIDISRKGLLELVNQLDEPEKPVVPQFVADWYEKHKEKRYYVKLKGVDENYNYLNHIKRLDAWCLTEIKKDKKFRSTHTRKQLEDAGFGEVFNSTLFEVEEVED